MFAVRCMLFTETAGGAKLVTVNKGRFGEPPTVMQFKQRHFADQLKQRMETQRQIRGITQLYEVVDLDQPYWVSPNQMYDVTKDAGYRGAEPRFSRTY